MIFIEKIKSITAAWWASVIIILITNLWIWILYQVPVCSSDNNYLLSSLNQSLAALFALVFALMFAITQIKKGNALDDIFTLEVFIYIISFIISILFPLLLIGTNNMILIKCAFSLAVINVSLLIPFFWRFKIKASKINTDDEKPVKKKVAFKKRRTK
jgi:hypothetical protein